MIQIDTQEKKLLGHDKEILALQKMMKRFDDVKNDISAVVEHCNLSHKEIEYKINIFDGRWKESVNDMNRMREQHRKDMLCIERVQTDFEHMNSRMDF